MIDSSGSLQQMAAAAWDVSAQAFKAVLQGTSEIVIAALNAAGAGDTIRAYSPLEPVGYTNIQYTYPDAVTTVETYKNGSTSVGVLTKVYTDATKVALTSVTRT